MDVVCVFLVLCSPLRSSFVSVVFDFNASLNDVAPLSPMLLSVELMRIEKELVAMDAICVLLLLITTQIELSECCVRFQCITQRCCTSFSNLVYC